MAQKVTDFVWDESKSKAVQLLADDRLSDEQIATDLGISRQTIARWKLIPEFRDKLNELRDAIEESIVSHGIARKMRRVRALNDRWERMQQVIAERAADQEVQEVPGGKTGLLVRNVKSVGKGEDAKLIDLYEVDTALLKELRDHEKQAAQELGQWTEKKDVTSGGQSLCKLYAFDPRNPTDPDDAGPS